ncbi:MAG: ABC transporter permease [Chryseotalea sp. WA131a]|nr:MAG: ABC transporter permease [Chryseotalea sp. WA131a]
MVNHIVKSAYKRILKHKTSYLICCLSLSIGLGIVFVLLQILMFELSFDSFHLNHKNKFLLEMEWNYNSTSIATPPPSGIYQVIKNESIVKNVCRAFLISDPLVYHEKVAPEKKPVNTLLKVDQEFFKIFTIETTSGDALKLFSDGRYILCTEKFAKTIHQSKSIVGDILKVEGKEYVICGIAKDWPINSSLKFDLIISTSSENLSANSEEELSFIYVELFDSESLSSLLQSLNSFIKSEFPENTPKLKGINIANQHIETDLLPNRISRLQLAIFSIVSVIILLITLSNYSSHSLTIAIKEMRSIGIKKILGINKSQLILGFFVEASLIVFSSVLLSLFLIWFLKNQLSASLSVELEFNTLSREFLFLTFATLIFCSCIITVFIYGTVTRISPSEILISAKLPKTFIHKSINYIVGFQCIVTSVFLALTMTVVQQRSYLDNLDIGFNKSNKLILDFESDRQSNQINNSPLLFKRETETLSGVNAASLTSFLQSLSIRSLRLGQTNENVEIYAIEADEGFIPLFNIEIVEGKNFSSRNELKEIILNTSAYEILKNQFQLQVGEPFPDIANSVIVGVVGNFLFNGFRSKNTPLILEYNANYSKRCIIQTTNYNEVLAGEIKQLWSKHFLGIPFEIKEFSPEYDKKFLPENRLSWILMAGAIMSIVICLLGFVGMAQYATTNRRKEMSIRKIFGSSSKQITILYFKKFLKVFFFSALLSTPITYLACEAFLNLFAYKIDFGLGIIVVCVLAQIFVILIIVSFQTIRSSMINPIIDLRYQ